MTLKVQKSLPGITRALISGTKTSCIAKLIGRGSFEILMIFFGLPGASWCLLSEDGYTRAVFVNKAQHQLLDTAASIKRIWNTWFFYYDVHGRRPTNQRRRAVDLWRRFLWRTAGHLGLPSTTDVCSVQSEHSADGHQNRSDSSLIRRWRDVVRTRLSRHLTDMMDGLTQRRTLKAHAQYKLVSWNIEEYNYC